MRSFLAGLVLLAGCQTLPSGNPARVDMNDPQTSAAVVAVLSKAVGRARIELGPSDGATISVLPPQPGPYETHSLAVPVHFDIVRRGSLCLAIRRDTQEAYELPGVSCW